MSESKKQELRILKREVSFQIVLILKKKLFYHATPTKGSILLETQQNSQNNDSVKWSAIYLFKPFKIVSF
jgi:hypothetical protein